MTLTGDPPPTRLEDGSTELEEGYRLIRRRAAIVPVARDVVSVSGPDAIEYMQGQCSQDVAALGVGDTADALLLEPQGRIDALIRVTRTSHDELIIDTDSGFGQAVVARLERFRLRVKVEISVLGWGCVAVRGPHHDRVSQDPGALKVPFEWPGITGFDLIGPAPQAPAGIGHAGASAWEAVRIEAGIPLMGTEIGEKTIPEEAGLVERCVSFTKGCYTGQELVARLDARGSNVARRLRGLVIRGGGPGPAVRAASEILADGKPSGVVSSVAWSPGLVATVALGYVHRSVTGSSTVTVDGLSAQVQPLPLVG